MKEGVSGSSVSPREGIVPSDAAKPENRTCCECGAAVSVTQAREEDVGPDVAIGFFRGLLVASVMTAFFGLLVLVGFVLGKLS